MKIDREQAIGYLTRWQQEGIVLGIYFAVPGAVAALTMLARVSEVSGRIALTNETATLRISLKDASFEFGPLQVVPFPSTRGPAVALTHLRDGLASVDGLHILLRSGHALFLCDSRRVGWWLQSSVASTKELEVSESDDSEVSSPDKL